MYLPPLRTWLASVATTRFYSLAALPARLVAPNIVPSDDGFQPASPKPLPGPQRVATSGPTQSTRQMLPAPARLRPSLPTACEIPTDLTTWDQTCEDRQCRERSLWPLTSRPRTVSSQSTKRPLQCRRQSLRLAVYCFDAS